MKAKSDFLRHYLLVILFLSCKALPTLNKHDADQHPKFPDLWAQVDSLEQEGLPQSALKIVEEIRNLANDTHDDLQKIKALIYWDKYQLSIQDLDLSEAIVHMESQVPLLEAPAKQILHSYLGELYMAYGRMNQWKLRDREVQADPPQDLELMSLADLQQKADAHYLRSIRSAQALAGPLENIDLLLQPAPLPAVHRFQSIYDLLVSRSLDHFENPGFSQNGITVFPLADSLYFAPRLQFSALAIDFSDSSDHKLQAFRIFQEVLSNPDSATLEFDLRRLDYFRRISSNYDKEKLYLNALKELINSTKEDDGKALVKYHLAAAYLQMDDFISAYRTCEEVMNAHPEAPSASECKQLMQRLEMPELRAQIEEVDIPGQKAPVSLTFKNLDTVYMKIFQLSPGYLEEFRLLVREDQLNFILKSSIVHEKTIALPAAADFKEHTSEVIVPALSLGQYAILFSTTRDFKPGSEIITGNTFIRSNLAYSTMGSHGEVSMHCFDRTDGRPLEGVKVEWYRQSYDRTRGIQVRDKVFESESNTHGRAEVPPSRGSYMPVLSKGEDHLDLSDSYINSFSWERPSTQQSDVSYFLDRSIYRPGQVVYFKAILLERDASNKPSISANKAAKVTLYDVNGQEVSTMNVRSNLYGSIHGSFTLPDGGLAGQMSIGIDLNSKRQYFRVEAYRRPTFKIEFDSITTAYKLSDSVAISGQVSSYSGAPLGNIDCFYRVVRKVRYPYLPGFRRIIWQSYPEREIASGTIKTARDGRFSFDFVARVDDLSGIEHSPVFDYVVELRAIDISGESLNNEVTVTLGSRPFGIIYDGPETIDLSKNNVVEFKVRNAEGNPVPGQGSVSLQLKGNDSWRRDRYWMRPDLPLLESNQYIDSLPNYRTLETDPDDLRGKEVGQIIMKQVGNRLVADLGDLVPGVGAYFFVVSVTDEKGNSEEATFELNLVDPARQFVPSEDLLLAFTANDDLTAGDTLQLNIGSPVTAQVFYHKERNNGLSAGEWMYIDEGWSKLMVPIERSDQGGLYVHLQMAYDNRIEDKTIEIDVPWKDKQLVIQTRSLRDLTRPGTRETVELEILHQGEGLEAEMLASMFDASLDALYPHQWSVDLYPRFYSTVSRSTPGFGISYGFLYFNDIRPEAINLNPQIVPTLNWFGFPMYGRMVMAEAVTSRAQRMNAPPPPEGKSADYAMQEKEAVEEDQGETVPEVREDFSENLFFYPDLHSDSTGKLSFNYEMNDALTTWRMMLFAHSKDLASDYAEYRIVSRKELMVTTNAPRFLRAGDQISLSCKVDNLTAESIETRLELVLKNALTQEVLTSALVYNSGPGMEMIEAGSAIVHSWQLRIPDSLRFPIEYTISAKSLHYEDAERGVIPVLINQAYVTSTRAFEIGAHTTDVIDLSSLLEQSSSEGKSGDITLEITANPVWYALKALPYLLEYPYESSDQIFNRLYANALGTRILQENPQLETVFRQWNAADKQSPLFADQDLKISTLEETPWLRNALNESEQTRRIAAYFADNSMAYEQKNTLLKLKGRQSDDGGFSWFPGGNSNWYISLYVTEGLQDLKEWVGEEYQPEIDRILEELVPFLDREVIRYYHSIEQQVEKGNAKWEDNHLSPVVCYYLKVRNPGVNHAAGEINEVYQYFLKQAIEYWTQTTLFSQTQIAAVFGRMDMQEERDKLIKSFRERRIEKESLGSYWKDANQSWFRWWDMPVSIQTEMIELFNQEGDEEIVNEAKRWLLNHKRTNQWGNTVATTRAIQALLSGSSNWFTAAEPVRVDVEKGQLKNDQTQSEISFLKQKYEILSDDLQSVKSIKVNNPNDHPAWGSAYYQFFEDLDEIREDREGPLKIGRELFREEYSDKGVELKRIDGLDLQPGDVLVVRIAVETDRDMDFVQVKDLRAAGLEPVEVLSNYEWNGGLGFYRANTDVSTSFFIDQLSRGKYVFSYKLRVSQRGDFSGGYASLQSLYAPEFASHSEGSRLEVRSIE
ncbi:MAG: hypothetical protein KDC80_24355 [Saprospiraceae bacterium]|nr:hypothetical protein [Saprospiraceae bacterium]